MTNASLAPPRDTLRIRLLNDRFRSTLHGGHVLITAGVRALSPDMTVQALKAVIKFDDFSPDNDPHGEHDFGSFLLDGHKLFFKIDYYDLKREFGSPDPADPKVTTRVLTILLASEY